MFLKNFKKFMRFNMYGASYKLSLFFTETFMCIRIKELLPGLELTASRFKRQTLKSLNK